VTMNCNSLWSIEPHTKAKHSILRKYLQAWFPIMHSLNQKRLVYIDGFAGPGRYKDGEDGSPLIALKSAMNHNIEFTKELVFLFVEARKDHCSHLKSVLQELELPSNYKVSVVNAAFDETLSLLLDAISSSGATLAPTFAFVDPFGYSHTPFSTIKRLMANPHCEVLINFMYQSINRFIGNEDQEGNFDDLFGTPNWRDGINLQGASSRKEFCHDIYLNQLRHTANIRYVRSFEMKDKQNASLYYLFFGTNHKAGLKKMKAAMWDVDPSGSFQYSDYTNREQLTLFEPSPDYHLLKRLICEEFKGKKVSIDQIEDFVVIETAFRETHYKREVLRSLEYSNPPEIVIHSSRSRRGTFPPGTIIEFV
jgi:three-Cys-motif partner protein